MQASVREKIELRAYELFLARGGKHGYHIEDWTQAEKEVTGKLGNRSPSTEKEKAVKTIKPKKSKASTEATPKKKVTKKKVD